MAENIELVGSFKDDITPKLKKLNRELQNIGRSFERFNKKISPVTKNFAKMAMSARTFSTAMQGQRKSIETSARAMREYSRQAGKMSSAMRKVQAQRSKAMREQGMSRAMARARGGMGGMGPMPKGGAGGGGAWGASAAQGFNSGIGSIAIGSAIGGIAANAIMRGVEGLKNLALAPFKKFGAMFSERIGDEMDDIKSAGGLFALDMDLTQASGNEKFFKNYNEALRFQEKLNIDMAESAASLPGVTSQYVSTSRQLTDTIQMVMEKDRESFNQLAAKYGANISGGGVDASKEAMRTVLQKQTEQVMLQSQGQTGGLPMHIAIQQLMGKEQGKINMTAFTNKFRAAFQKNPLLKNFLLRAQDEMNNTAAGSADRLKVIMDTFDRAMPKEVINKMRGSISGMQEALRSGLLDPQAGLFGMSRANLLNGQKLMKKNVDDFGNVLYKISADMGIDENFAKQLQAVGIDKKAGDTLKGAELTADQIAKLGFSLNEAGKIIGKGGQEIGDVSKSSTYIFEQIREILAGFGPVLLEFVGFLPSLFDPFGQMTANLMSFRDKAQEFIQGFNKRLDIIENAALEFSNMDDPTKQGLGSTLKSQSRSRAAMDTVASYLKGIGAINDDLFKEIRGKTQDFTEKGITDFDLGDTVGKLLKATLESDLMKDFAKIGGLIVGGITKAVVDVIAIITGMVKGKMGNKLTEGFMEGFKDAFGGMNMAEVTGIITDAIAAIMVKIGDILVTKVLPAAGLMIIQTLTGMLISGNIVGMILGALGLAKVAMVIAGVITSLSGFAASIAAMNIGGLIAGWAPAIVSGFQIIMAGITGTFLPIMASLGSAIMGVVAAVLPIIGIVAAITGVVMATVAVFRHLDLITSSVVEGFKILANTFTWIDSTIKSAILNFAASLMEGLSSLPFGIGNAFKGGAAAAREKADLHSVKAMQAQTEMANSLDVIAQNTSKSLDRTQEDFKTLANMVGLGGESAPLPTTAVMKPVKAPATPVIVEEVKSEVSKQTPRGRSGAARAAQNNIVPTTPNIPAPPAAPTTPTTPNIPAPPAAPTTPTTPNIPAPPAAPTTPAAPTAEFPTEAITKPVAELKPPMEATQAATEALKPPMEATQAATEALKTATEGTKTATEATKIAVEGAKESVDMMKAELPPAIDQSIQTGVQPLITAMEAMGTTVSSAAQEVVAALSQEMSQQITVDKILNPVAVTGNFGGGGTAEAKYKGNVFSAAGGMNLGSAIATEMKNKPAGSDLVIANSAETIIPPGMTATTPMAAGRGDVNMGGITINISGVNDPKEIADQVAQELLVAIQHSTYNEINIS